MKKITWEDFLTDYDDAYEGYKSAGATDKEAHEYAWVDTVSHTGMPNEDTSWK